MSFVHLNDLSPDFLRAIDKAIKLELLKEINAPDDKWFQSSQELMLLLHVFNQGSVNQQHCEFRSGFFDRKGRSLKSEVCS